MNDQSYLEFQKTLANPMGLDVKETKRIPVQGDKVRIICLDLFSAVEARQLLKGGDIVTVDEVMPMVIGNAKNRDEADTEYHWEYEIISKEFPDNNILGWHYKFV